MQGKFPMTSSAKLHNIEDKLVGERGWKEILFPDSYAESKSFLSEDEGDNRFKKKYFIRQTDNAFMAKVWFGPATEGPPGHAHGGSMASILDEAMGFCAWLAGHTVVAAQLIINFRKMLPLNTIVT